MGSIYKKIKLMFHKKKRDQEIQNNIDTCDCELEENIRMLVNNYNCSDSKDVIEKKNTITIDSGEYTIIHTTNTTTQLILKPVKINKYCDYNGCYICYNCYQCKICGKCSCYKNY